MLLSHLLEDRGQTHYVRRILSRWFSVAFWVVVSVRVRLLHRHRTVRVLAARMGL